jgi:endonuclease/exonuclease/phosphatase family metal-dependent hydrolase/2'-5' RNA ligase
LIVPENKGWISTNIAFETREQIRFEKVMVSSHFKLTSTATAIAIVAPEHLRPEINSLRKLHDKAYRKWEPHINLLYPFVDPSQLAAATSILRQHLLNNQTERLRVDLNHVDVFTHRRNATVFLKPGFESEEAICQLRASLAIALGCDDSEGTHDGKFRPHMTIGQAGLTGLQLERLSEKVGKLTGVTWEGRSLVVLKRQPTGEMSMVEELPFGILDNGEASNESLGANHDGYKDCFSFSRHMGWTTGTNLDKPTTDACQMTVATYNLMSEPSATPFLSRLPLIIDSIKSSTASSHALVRVLCLQEVDEEMLPLLLADPFIHENYPHSSHSPSSLLLSHRNLVTMSSEPFRYTIIDFDERHKCMLDICLLRLPIRVVNVHLSSSLTNEAVRVKQNQMEKVTKFTTTSEATDHRDVIVAGDFNLTTSSRTIQTALSGRIISLETAQLIGKVIDPSIWVDAFMTCSNDDLTEEEIAEGEEGATFDRSTNPLAAMSEPPIDRSPQRYDRVLFRRGGHVEAQQVERFGFPTDFGDCGSDHYGVCATLRLGKPEALDTSHSSTEQTKLIDVIEDVYAVLPLIQPYLPSQEDRRQREEALGLLHQTLSRDGSMEDLILAPLGSYLMDTYFSDSDVDVLAIASVAPKVFFEHASAQLQELSAHGDDENDFKGVHFVNSLVSIIELTARGIKFDLQYCQAPELVDKYVLANYSLLCCSNNSL